MSAPPPLPVGRRVVWDEAVIAEHDRERGTRQKIAEPKTPFRGPSPSSAMSSDDELRGGWGGRDGAPASSSLMAVEGNGGNGEPNGGGDACPTVVTQGEWDGSRSSSVGGGGVGEAPTRADDAMGGAAGPRLGRERGRRPRSRSSQRSDSSVGSDGRVRLHPHFSEEAISPTASRAGPGTGSASDTAAEFTFDTHDAESGMSEKSGFAAKRRSHYGGEYARIRALAAKQAEEEEEG